MYFTVPVLAPFAPYFKDPHWVSATLYIVAVGGVSGVLARSKSWPRTIAFFFGVTFCGALITHVTLNVLGYKYFMETP